MLQCYHSSFSVSLRRSGQISSSQAESESDVHVASVSSSHSGHQPVSEAAV